MAAASGAAASLGRSCFEQNAPATASGASPSQTLILPTPSTVSSKRTHEVSPRSPVSATCDAESCGEAYG